MKESCAGFFEILQDSHCEFFTSFSFSCYFFFLIVIIETWQLRIPGCDLINELLLLIIETWQSRMLGCGGFFGILEDSHCEFFTLF